MYASINRDVFSYVIQNMYNNIVQVAPFILKKLESFMYIGLGFWKTSSRKIYAVPESQLQFGKGKCSRLQESDDDDELDYAPVRTCSKQQQCCSDVMLEVKSLHSTIQC